MIWSKDNALAAALILALALGVSSTGQGDEAEEPSNPVAGNEISGTAYAIDGDTIRIEGEGKVRLQGVAAPEKSEQGGMEATDFMKRLVNGKDVRCQLDGSRTYDRRVGICFLEGADVGEAVIAAGLARDCPRYSDGRYRGAEGRESARLSLPGYCEVR